MSVPAFVLHARPYRETSALVDFFTPQGRLTGVLRGARSKRGSLGRPFLLLEADWKGAAELKTITRLDAAGIPLLLAGTALFSALYLNELLVRLLPLEDPHPLLFARYLATLNALAAGEAIEPLLRGFEWQLLDELGYGFPLDCDDHGQPVQPEGWYRWQVEAGLQPVQQLQSGLFRGGDLLAMSRGDWSSPGSLAAAKRLMRQALAAHLGGRPLVSRELFIQRKESPRD